VVAENLGNFDELEVIAKVLPIQIYILKFAETDYQQKG